MEFYHGNNESRTAAIEYQRKSYELVIKSVLFEDKSTCIFAHNYMVEVLCRLRFLLSLYLIIKLGKYAVDQRFTSNKTLWNRLNQTKFKNACHDECWTQSTN